MKYRNKTGDDGAKFLAEGIGASKSLSKLNLDGFDLPIKDLRGDTNVSKLDFSSKGLTSRSAIVIAKLLPDNKSLSELNLGGNNIGEKYANEHEIIGDSYEVGSKVRHNGKEWTIVKGKDLSLIHI